MVVNQLDLNEFSKPRRIQQEKLKGIRLDLLLRVLVKKKASIIKRLSHRFLRRILLESLWP